MLRLALAASLMYGAMGLTYSGSMFTLYTQEKESSTTIADHVTECTGDGVAIGSTASNGPDFTGTTGVQIEVIKPVIIGACYEITATAELFPTTSDFAAGEAETDKIVDESGATSVTQIKFATAATGITMLPYTDSFVSGTAAACSGTAGTARTAVTTSPGWQCTAAKGAMTTGFALAANTDLGVVDNIVYVTVEKYGGDSSHTSTAGGLCSGTADVVQGRNRVFWPVTPGAYTASLGPANAAAVGAGLFVNLQAGFCFSNDYDANGQNAAPTTWNLVCSGTNGAITYTQGTNLECDWATAGNEVSQVFTKNDKCVNPLVLVTPTLTESWNIKNSDTEYETICPTHGVVGGTTGVKTLKVYATTTALARAAATLESAMTAAGVTGSRDIMLGLCYTATADGEIGGFVGGPFSDGTTDTEPVADKGSFMWAEDVTVATEVELLWWATDDCTGASSNAAGGTVDDGHDATTGWPYEGFAVFSSAGALVTGTASAAGTTVSSLTAATKYITVKRHTDTTTANALHGAAGICLGGGTEVVGRVLDHFVLGNCHIHTGSATAANQKSYKWWCDDNTIKYAEYVGEACAGTATTGTALSFTKASTGSGATTAGGKCLQVGATGSNVSWEIRNDDTQWDVMCPSASSDDSDDSDSSAGKIAATVAAGAAAAAALLI